MENKEKTVLLNVEIKAKEALKELAQLRLRSDELRAAQKALDRTNAETRPQYEALGQQIRALNKEGQRRQKVIQNEINVQNMQESSLERLRAELSLMNQQYASLTKEEATNTKQGHFLAASIEDTTAKLNKAEQELGNYHRQVGNYGVATVSLKAEMKKLTTELVNMKLAGEEGTAEYRKMSEELAKLKDVSGAVSAQTKALASSTRTLDTVTQSITTLTAGFAVYTSAAGLSADSAEEMQKAMKNLQVVAVALSAAITIQNNLQKQSLLYQQAQILLSKIGINQTLRAAAAEAAYTKVKAAGTLGSKLAAAATWLWNAALASNPVVLVALAVAALVAGLYLLVKAFDFSTDAEKNAKKAGEDYEKQQERTAIAVENATNKMNSALSRRTAALQDEILLMLKNGATTEEVAKAKAKAEEEMADIAIKASLEKEKALRAEYKSLQTNIKAQRAQLASLKVGSKAYEEQLKAVNDLIRANNELVGSINVESETRKQAEVDRAEAKQKSIEAGIETDKKAAAESLKKYQDNALRILESQKKLADEQSKLKAVSVAKDFASQTKWESEEFERLKKHEIEKLKLQKQFGKISDSEHSDALKILDAGATAFYAQQLQGTRDHYAERLKAIKASIALSEEEEKQATRNKYNSDIAELKEHNKKVMAEYDALAIKTQTASANEITGLGALTEAERKRYAELQNMAFENAAVITALEKQKLEEIEALNKASVLKKVGEIDEVISGQYALDLAKFTDNEKMKLRIEKEMTRKKIAQLKDLLAAEPDPKLKLEIQKKLYAEEAKMRDVNSNLILSALHNELANATLTAEERYKTKRKFLKLELEAAEGNSEREAAIFADMAEARNEYMQQTISNVGTWAGATMEVLSTIDKVKTDRENVEMAKYLEDNEAKLEALDSRLERGAISQEEYNSKVSELEAEKAGKEKKLAYDQAKRSKQMAIMNATIQAGLAIASSLAQSPVAIGPIPNPAGIASLALATLMGGMAMATAISTPLPKASRGILLRGRSHAQGGIPIEAEGGEAIINRKSTSMFAPLLSAINEAGGGVKFAAGGIPVAMKSDGGYKQRSDERRDQSISKEELDEVVKTIKELKIFVAVSDIRKADEKYTEINDTNPNY